MTDNRSSRNGTSIKINTEAENEGFPDETVDPEAEAEKPAEGSSGADAADDTIPDPEPVDDLTVLLEAARKEAAESHDRFLRVSAEFDNFKKRQIREVSEFKKFANEQIIKDLLPIVDNLERAVESSTDAAEADRVREGVALTLKELLKVFERHGVEAIDAMGQPFDPTYHQAVSQEASEEHPVNTVIHQLQKGYTLRDRLIRPAMVVVAKATAANSES